MKKNVVGQTGIIVSALGLGTVKWGRNQAVHYPEPFELPTDDCILNLLAVAQAGGINLLDTAPAYGVSEERLGKLLKNQRQAWVISTKVGEEFFQGQSHYDFSAATVEKSIERSLQRLQTDYLDIVLAHSNGEDNKIIEQDAIFDVLERSKKAGKIRAFGMSTKTLEGGLNAISRSDVVMMTFNPIHASEKPIIEAACLKNKGIFIKKAFASGHLDKLPGSDPIAAALQFIFQQPGVSSVILGTMHVDHLRHNIECTERILTE